MQQSLTVGRAGGGAFEEQQLGDVVGTGVVVARLQPGREVITPEPHRCGDRPVEEVCIKGRLCEWNEPLQVTDEELGLGVPVVGQPRRRQPARHQHLPEPQAGIILVLDAHVAGDVVDQNLNILADDDLVRHHGKRQLAAFFVHAGEGDRSAHNPGDGDQQLRVFLVAVHDFQQVIDQIGAVPGAAQAQLLLQITGGAQAVPVVGPVLGPLGAGREGQHHVEEHAAVWVLWVKGLRLSTAGLCQQQPEGQHQCHEAGEGQSQQGKRMPCHHRCSHGVRIPPLKGIPGSGSRRSAP